MITIAALILAAGRSTRMGGPNKLLRDFRGRALVRCVAEAALASRARPVVVVTGHQRAAIEAALGDLALLTIHNPDFARGLSTSLKAGIAALPPDIGGAVVLLGDMPRVSAALIDRLVEVFERTPDAAAVVPVHAGARGNPVLLARRLFLDVAALTGDEGARRLLRSVGPATTESDRHAPFPARPRESEDPAPRRGDERRGDERRGDERRGDESPGFPLSRERAGQSIEGFVSKRCLVGRGDVVEVACEDPAVMLDIDTPEALDRLRGEGT